MAARVSAPNLGKLESVRGLDHHELETRRRAWYVRHRFGLWLPEDNSPLNGNAEDFLEEDDDAGDGASRRVRVDVLLQRLLVKRVRRIAMSRLLKYLAFFACYSVALVLQRNLESAYALEAATKERLLSAGSLTSDRTFLDVDSVEDLWDWLEGGFVESVFPDTTWYNGEPIDADDDEAAGYVFWYSKPVSGFELVQHRVKTVDGCDVIPGYCDFYPTVWPRTGDRFWAPWGREASPHAAEERAAFGPAYDDEKYEWRTDESGEFGGGAHMVSFSNDRTLARHQLRELKLDRWIDKQTREVAAVTTFFNGNSRVFVVVTLRVLLGETGRVATSMEIRSLRLENFVSAGDFARVVFEVLALAGAGKECDIPNFGGS